MYVQIDPYCHSTIITKMASQDLKNFKDFGKKILCIGRNYK